jgi:hypothetical protein
MAEKKAEKAVPTEIDKHVETVKIKNIHTDPIEFKHGIIKSYETGLATIAEAEALHAFVEVINE